MSADATSSSSSSGGVLHASKWTERLSGHTGLQQKTSMRQHWVFVRDLKTFKGGLKNAQVYCNPWGGTASIRVNKKYMACAWKEGTQLSVTSLAGPDGSPQQLLPCCANRHRVMDFAFDPFVDDIVATCSTDGEGKLWRIGKDTTDPPKPIVTFGEQGDMRAKLNTIVFHPRAEHLVCTSSSGFVVSLWDIESSPQQPAVGLAHPDAVYNSRWSSAGGLLLTSCKDHMLRLFDPRAGHSAIHEILGHGSTKCTSVEWLDGTVGADGHHFVSVGFSKEATRQIAVWDVRRPQGSVSVDVVDKTMRGTPIIAYDQECGLLALAQKGDPVVKYFEVPEEKDKVVYLNEFKFENSIKGFALSVPDQNQPVSTADLPDMHGLVAKGTESHRLQRSQFLAQALIDRKLRERTVSQAAREKASQAARRRAVAEYKKQASTALQTAADWLQGVQTSSLASVPEHVDDDDEDPPPPPTTAPPPSSSSSSAAGASGSSSSAASSLAGSDLPPPPPASTPPTDDAKPLTVRLNSSDWESAERRVRGRQVGAGSLSVSVTRSPQWAQTSAPERLLDELLSVLDDSIAMHPFNWKLTQIHQPELLQHLDPSDQRNAAQVAHVLEAVTSRLLTLQHGSHAHHYPLTPAHKVEEPTSPVSSNGSDKSSKLKEKNERLARRVKELQQALKFQTKQNDKYQNALASLRKKYEDAKKTTEQHKSMLKNERSSAKMLKAELSHSKATINALQKTSGKKGLKARNRSSSGGSIMDLARTRLVDQSAIGPSSLGAIREARSGTVQEVSARIARFDYRMTFRQLHLMAYMNSCWPQLT